MPTTTAPGPLETEFMKATKLRQAANEARHKYLERLLEAGQKLPPSLWAALSPEAQAWYNDGINAFNVHGDAADIPDFVDAAPPQVTQRAAMQRKPAPEPEPEPEPVAEVEEEPEPDEEPEPEEGEEGEEGEELEEDEFFDGTDEDEAEAEVRRTRCSTQNQSRRRRWWSR